MITTVLPIEVRVDALYNISQAARLLGVSRKTVYRMIEENRLKANLRKIDNRLVVTGQEIKKAITCVF